MINFGASALLGYRFGTLNIEKTREVPLIPGEANTRSLKMLMTVITERRRHITSLFLSFRKIL